MRLVGTGVRYATPESAPAEEPVSIARSAAKQMATYLPPYYDTSRIMQALLETEGVEFDLLRYAIDSLLDQAYAARATWALDRWERFVGLVAPPGADDQARRDRVIARLRARGTPTSARVEFVIAAFTLGTAVVEDSSDDPAIPAYTVRVRFIDVRGLPPGLEDVKREVRRVVHAHLAIEYVFLWLTWNQLDAHAWTWDQIDGTALGGPAGAPLTWSEFEVLE